MTDNGQDPLVIDRFEGVHAFLSNFWPSPVVFPTSGPDAANYPTVEHAFQAAKTLDPAERERIRLARTPAIAKKLGRHVTMTDDWQVRRIEVMHALLRAKFGREPLRSQLLSTGDARLIEGNNWHDQTWGQCQCDRHAAIPGENLLGTWLMVVRAELAMGADSHL
jgi:N-glycosidase YbiA